MNRPGWLDGSLPTQGHISPSHFGRYPRSSREAFGCQYGPIEGPDPGEGALAPRVVVALVVVAVLVLSVWGLYVHG